MPIDASIPLGVRPPAINPMETMQALLGIQNAQAQARANQLDLTTRQRAMDDDTALRSAMQKRTRGNGLIDWDGAVGDLEASGNAPAAFKLRDFITKQRKEQADTLEKSLKNTQSKLEIATRVVQGIEAEANENPLAADDAFQRGTTFLASVVGQEVADQLGDRYEPARIKAALTWGRTAADQIRAQRDALAEAGRLVTQKQTAERDAPAIAEAWTKIGSKALSIAQNQDQWTKALRNLNDIGMPVGVQDVFGDVYSPEAAANAAKLGMTPKEQADLQGSAATRAETKRHNIATEANASARLSAESETPHLTPEAIDTIAHSFAMGQPLPAMGMGKQATLLRTKIMNRAAELYQGLDLPSQQAAYKANQASLVKLTQQKDAVEAFEKTALANLDVFIDTAKQVVDTGSPYLNRPLRSLNEGLLGSPKMAAFNAAHRVVIPEFARIIANPNLTGVLSDTARKEVEEVLKGNATLPQILSVAQVLKTDAKNRTQSLSDQIGEVQKRIAKPPAGMSTSGGSDKVRLIDNTGKKYQVPADKVDQALEDFKDRGLRRAP